MRKYGSSGVLATARRVSVLGTALVAVGLGATVPASAGTDNFGHAVYQCGRMMLPYDIGPHGGITMTMPDGTTMHWRSFGEMVTSMRSHDMC